MIVKDPKVTLDIDGHGFPDEAREGGFLDWLCCLSAYGDDGKQYWLECNPMSTRFEKVDLWVMQVSWEKGKVIKPAGSPYPICDFPAPSPERYIYPAGALTIKRSAHEVAIDVGDAHLRCKEDRTWHYSVEDKNKGIKADWVHSVTGYPTWYGREKPLAITPHSITYGYNQSGTVEGTLTIQGKKVKIKGAGVRERYYAVDTCAAEIGGWEDWMWFHFDEMFGSMYEFKFSNVKDMSLNIREGNQFFPVVKFNIEHHDWAYLKQVGVFLPTGYVIKGETEAGVIEISANVVGCKLWGSRGQLPDAPVISLNWENVQGSFTYKDGHKKKLTNGFGGTTIRQWKPYPNLLMPKDNEELQHYTDRVHLFE